VDTEFHDQSKFMMRLDNNGIVLVIGCRKHHYALLEADPKKKKSHYLGVHQV
jgi:hypothetical protein